MAKTIQVRNVPDEVHQELKLRAVENRQSLSDFVLSELERVASRPTQREMAERFERLEPVKIERSVVDLIAEGRRERDEQIAAALGHIPDSSRDSS